MKERFNQPNKRVAAIGLAVFTALGAVGVGAQNTSPVTESASSALNSTEYKNGGVVVSFPSETLTSPETSPRLTVKNDEFWSKVESITEVKSAEDIIKDLEAAYQATPNAEDTWSLEFAKEAFMIGETGIIDPATEDSPDEQVMLFNRLTGYYVFVSQLAEKVYPNTENERFLNGAIEAAKRAKDTIAGFDFEEFSRNDMFQKAFINGMLPYLYKGH